MKKHTSSYQKMFKVALASAMAAGAIVTVAPAVMQADAPVLKDLEKGQDYYSDVLNLVERGIVKGFKDGTYKPYQEVSRGQAAKILAGILKLDTTNVVNPGFTDVKVTDEYYGAIAALANAGIISGYPDKTFKQRGTLKRSHMAKILTLGFDFENKSDSLTDTRFTDVKPTDEFAGYVQTLLTNEITKGKTATTFGPFDAVLRGQMASFVVRSEKAAAALTPTPKPDPTPNPNPTPDTSANQLLNDKIKAAFALGNPVSEQMTITLDGKTFNVKVLNDATTLGSFTTEAKKVFDIIQNNATVTIVKLYVGGNPAGEVNVPAGATFDFDALAKRAFDKVDKSETDSIAFLKGLDFTVNVTGAIGTAGFSDSYTFKIQ